MSADLFQILTFHLPQLSGSLHAFSRYSSYATANSHGGRSHILAFLVVLYADLHMSLELTIDPLLV